MIKATKVIGTVGYEFYDGNGNEYTLEEILVKLNTYNQLLRELKSNGDFDVLLELMNDNNLTWGAVCNIIKEALTDD